MKFQLQRDKNRQLGLLKNLLSMHKTLFASLFSTILPFQTLFYCYLSVIILLYQQPLCQTFFFARTTYPQFFRITHALMFCTTIRFIASCFLGVMYSNKMWYGIFRFYSNLPIHKNIKNIKYKNEHKKVATTLKYVFVANIHNISMAPLYLDILGNIMATNNSVNRVNHKIMSAEKII